MYRYWVRLVVRKKYLNLNRSFKAINILLISFYLFSCDSIVQYYQSYKRANTNPYFNFSKSLECQCDQDNIITPRIAILQKKSELKKVDSKFEFLPVSRNDSHPDKNLYLKYNINQCGMLIFNPNDIVFVKGRIQVADSDFIIEPVDGYIEINGKKFCLE